MSSATVNKARLGRGRKAARLESREDREVRMDMGVTFLVSI